MQNVILLGANKPYDTSKQVLKENQIVEFHGAGASLSRFVVYRADLHKDRYDYHLINVETKEFHLTDLVRPLHEKFGIGMYYNALEPQFMDAFEVLMLKSEADYQKKETQEKQQKEQERREQLKTIGRERLQNLIHADAKAIILAELHNDESDSMTDYFGFSTEHAVILGFSTHTKDLFSEMRKYAANFEGTAYLAEENKEYEHREKYTGGSGYYLGKSKYSGWIVTKERFYGSREQYIDRYALIAGDEANIQIKANKSETETDTKTETESITGDFEIVDYSEKALALFGDTKPIKDQLKACGGRFNPKLACNNGKRAGWIFSKTKGHELRDLLTIN
jgi:hypothetical protein